MIRLEVLKINGKSVRVNLLSVDAAIPAMKEFRKVDLDNLMNLVTDLTQFIPSTFLQNGPGVELLEKLKNKSHALFQILLGDLGVQLRTLANHQNPQVLLVLVDEELAHLPIDILFTGEIFLWQGFIISRQIITTDKIVPSRTRSGGSRRITLIGDPSSDPALRESVQDELLTIADTLDSESNVSGPHFGPETTQHQLIEWLTTSDLLHFSGHYQTSTGEESGWLLANNQLFQAEDIRHMTQLPQFIFSNTCGSPFSIASDGFIRQFLSSGVSTMLISIGEIPSTQAGWFGKQFYQQLLNGKTYGEALFHSRHSLVSRYGLSDLTWMFYTMYGDGQQRPGFVTSRGGAWRQKLWKGLIVSGFTLCLVIGMNFLYQRFRTGSFHISSVPLSCEVSRMGEVIGSTPLKLRLRAGDQIHLTSVGHDSLKLVAKHAESGWLLIPEQSVQGLISNTSIRQLSETYTGEANLVLIPEHYSEVIFDMTGYSGSQLVIQGSPVQFSGTHIVLAVDIQPFRFILKIGSKVFDQAITFTSDSLITAAEIIDTWPEGRYH